MDAHTFTHTIKWFQLVSAKCWEEISSISLCHAWNKLLSGGNEADDQITREELPGIGEQFDQLGISEYEREEWLTADKDLTKFQKLNGEEILDLVR